MNVELIDPDAMSTETTRYQSPTPTTALLDALREAGARHRWSAYVDDVDCHIHCYLKGGRVVLVQEFANGGWEAFTPACDTLSIVDTYAALGLEA